MDSWAERADRDCEHPVPVDLLDSFNPDQVFTWTLLFICPACGLAVVGDLRSDQRRVIR